MNKNNVFSNLVKISALLVVFCMLTGCGKKETEVFYEDYFSSKEGTEVKAVEESSAKTGAEYEEPLIIVEEDVKAPVMVHVCGAVQAPGVYELMEDSRVQDVVEMAGGLLEEADLSFTNLAMKVSDGEKIYIPTKQEAERLRENGGAGVFLTEQSGEVWTKSQAQTGGKVNINTADVTLLCTLSGIGDSRAESIITYRRDNGAFETIEDIMKVPGIKEAAFQKIKDNICVN